MYRTGMAVAMAVGFGMASLTVHAAPDGARMFETQTALVVDPEGDQGDATVGARAGLGYNFSERFSAGLYASWTDADRRYPSRMDAIYGVGLFGERTFRAAETVAPFVGLRLGIEDGTGPEGWTRRHVAATAGLKIAWTDAWLLSLAGNAHWADDDLFNYEESAPGVFQMDDTNFTVELGLRFRFE